LPFSGGTVTETLDRIVHAQPDAIARLSYAAPLELERIIRKTLEKEASRRYQHARDALIDFNNLKRDSDSSVHASPAARKRIGKAIDSVAVLPLATTSADDEIDYLADGITESLIDALSQLPRLKVMARSTVFRYKAKSVDALTVGRELGVRAVVLGRLQRLAGRVVLRGELVDANDGSHLWGGQFQRDAGDVLALQEDLAQEVADQLRLRLTRDDRRRLRKRHTESVRAYEAYMRGRYQLAKRTDEGFTKAIEAFEAAITEDARYALAYAGLADCYTLLGTAAYVEAPDAAIAKARQSAERAIELDDQLAEAHSALGFVQFRINWDWAAAEASLKRASELNPGAAPTHHRQALLLTALGRRDEAIAAIRRAYELDPLSLIIGTALGRILHFFRRYDEAVAQLRHTLEIDGQFLQAHFDLAMAFTQLGRFDDARAELKSLLDASDRRSVMLAVLGNLCAVSGDRPGAAAALSELRDRHAHGRATVADLGYVLAGLGEIEEAVDCFERAADARAGLIVYLKVEPMVDPLRVHPRFVKLLERLRLAL
jgi:TolB-like protein/Flp pilus assembly protein TadD